MAITVYAKSGFTVPSGKAFKFTGYGSMSNWEVVPITSGFPHGIAILPIDEYAQYDAVYLGAGPVEIQISENIAADDELSLSATGFKKRTATDPLIGEALFPGNAGGSCIAFIHGLNTGFNMSGLTTGDLLIFGKNAWQRLSPSTSGQALLSNGAGMLPAYQTLPNNLLQIVSTRVTADQSTTSTSLVDLTGSSMTINTSASTKLVIQASYSMSNSSALGSINRIAVVIDGVVEPGASSAFQTPLISNFSQGGAINIVKTGLTAGLHTIKLQWSNTAGTTQCRPLTGAPNTEHASLVVMESLV